MDLSLMYKFKESKVDKQSRIVVAGVLEEDVLSENRRFYPSKIVREAVAKLPGRKSMIGHDSDSPMDTVAVIERVEHIGKLAVGHFRFGTDQVSETMLTKVKDGLVDSFSIRASGSTRKGKIEGVEEMVDIVTELDIQSVDLVTMPGVKSAKVLQVFENVNYKFIESKGDKDMDEFKSKYEETQKKLIELELKLNEEAKSRKAAEEKAHKAELESYINEKLQTISDEKVRGLIKKQLTGESKDKINAQFAEQVDYFKSIHKQVGSEVDIVITPADHKEGDVKKSFGSLNELLESKDVSKEDKLGILSMALNGGRIRRS